MYLYHICREKDRYNFDEGYIGVSVNPEYRWKQHRVKCNQRLSQAYKDYDDIIHYIIVQSTEDYILELEQNLRPEAMMGWNMAMGGGKPPVGSMTGRKHSEKSKLKVSNSKKGKCSGVNHPMYGKKHKPETIEKFRQAKLGRRFNRENITCPHCGKNGGSNLMKRYHFDNCSNVMSPLGFFDNITEAMNGTGYSEKSIRTWCSSKNKPLWNLLTRNQTEVEENVE